MMGDFNNSPSTPPQVYASPATNTSPSTPPLYASTPPLYSTSLVPLPVPLPVPKRPPSLIDMIEDLAKHNESSSDYDSPERHLLYLIRSGAINPHDEPNKYGDTPLIVACKYGLDTIAFELLKTGESLPDHTNHFGKSAISYITQDHMPRTTSLLFEQNPRILESPQFSYKTFEPLSDDPVYAKFDTMMAPFREKMETIIYKNGYIKDTLLPNTTTNPYLVHYEEFNGKSYPVITLMKGTVLFTARKNKPRSKIESYYHLYKLHNHPTLNDYQKDNFKDTLTYFFPIPSISHYVSDTYKQMDMVVLTRDIRLACLVSPSPLSRSIKNYDDTPHIKNNDFYVDASNSIYYDPNTFGSCKDRDYDLCISSDIIMGLKLNGYIAIAFEDSLTNNLRIDENELYKQTLLYLSGCFTNEIYSRQHKIAGNNFVPKMTDSRTYGIPEVVLIPYDLHSYPDPAEYRTVYSEWLTKSTLDDSHFIFKHVDDANGIFSIDLGKSMREKLMIYNGIQKQAIHKSLQCYPLFSVLDDDVDDANREYIVRNSRPVEFREISFLHSYKNPASGKSAFETNLFYMMLENEAETYVGGRLDTAMLSPNPMQNQKRMPIQKRPTTPMKKHVFDIAKRKPISFEDENMYYSEANGIPIVVYKKGMKKVGGDKKKTRKVKKTRRTKKTRQVKSKR